MIVDHRSDRRQDVDRITVVTLAVAAFAMPAAVIIVVSEFILRSEVAVVALMVLWFAIAAAIGIPLVNVASRTIGSRRENLALVAQGK